MKIKDNQGSQVFKSSQRGEEANVPTDFTAVDVVELSLDKIALSADYEEGSSSLEPEKHVHPMIMEKSPCCHSDSSDSSNILCKTTDENDVPISATVKTSYKAIQNSVENSLISKKMKYSQHLDEVDNSAVKHSEKNNAKGSSDLRNVKSPQNGEEREVSVAPTVEANLQANGTRGFREYRVTRYFHSNRGSRNSVDQEGKDLKGRHEKAKIYHNGKDAAICQSNKESVRNASPSSSKNLNIKDCSMKNKIGPSEIPSLPFPSFPTNTPASKNKRRSNSPDKFPSLPHSAKTSSSKQDGRQAENKENDKSCLQSEDNETRSSDEPRKGKNSQTNETKSVKEHNGIEYSQKSESFNMSDKDIKDLILKHFSMPRKEVEERSQSFSTSYDDSHSRSGEYITHSTPRNSSNEEFEQSRNQKASPSYEETRWFHYQGKAKKRLNFSGLKSTFSNSYLERLWNEIVDEFEESSKESKENITDMKDDSSFNICLSDIHSTVEEPNCVNINQKLSSIRGKTSEPYSRSYERNFSTPLEKSKIRENFRNGIGALSTPIVPGLSQQISLNPSLNQFHEGCNPSLKTSSFTTFHPGHEHLTGVPNMGTQIPYDSHSVNNSSIPFSVVPPVNNSSTVSNFGTDSSYIPTPISNPSTGLTIPVSNVVFRHSMNNSFATPALASNVVSPLSDSLPVSIIETNSIYVPSPMNNSSSTSPLLMNDVFSCNPINNLSTMTFPSNVVAPQNTLMVPNFSTNSCVLSPIYNSSPGSAMPSMYPYVPHSMSSSLTNGSVLVIPSLVPLPLNSSLTTPIFQTNSPNVLSPVSNPLLGSTIPIPNVYPMNNFAPPLNNSLTVPIFRPTDSPNAPYLIDNSSNTPIFRPTDSPNAPYPIDNSSNTPIISLFPPYVVAPSNSLIVPICEPNSSFISSPNNST
ncbi:hypothetical protein Anas_11148 [Armadillidium nasatum]|uniref:Uncharacterized protein n=1 Tax=Armadillidium nasatum TaxID=96803 RepID=A0A5N5SXZ6_9CRUS|nr:hypothetical protein Anas_11148 [Armadillidium nasatum]